MGCGAVERRKARAGLVEDQVQVSPANTTASTVTSADGPGDVAQRLDPGRRGLTGCREFQVDPVDLVDFLRSGRDHLDGIERAEQRGLDREARPEERDAEKPRSRRPRAVTSSMSTMGIESRFLSGPSATCGVTAGMAKKSRPRCEALRRSPRGSRRALDPSGSDVSQRCWRIGVDDRYARHGATIRAARGNRPVVDDGCTDSETADQPDVLRVRRRFRARLVLWHQCSGVAAGSCTVTQSPPAVRGVRVRVPSCAWVMLLTIARPRPTPARSVRVRLVPR